MNLFTDHLSAAGARQLDAQLQLLRSAAGSALDGAEQLAALQFAATRGALEKSTELLRQVAAARDPRDFFALAGQGQFQFDSVLAYQRKLFGIATAMTGSVAGLQRTITPAASAALQKLAALPPVAEVTVVADRIIEQTNEVVEKLADELADESADKSADKPADDSAHAAAAPPVQADLSTPVVDDIIEQTNDVVETLAADAEQALEAPTAAADVAPAEPIAELNPIAAAAGHQAPPASTAAPFTVASSDTPIEVEQVAPVSIAKSGARPRKK